MRARFEFPAKGFLAISVGLNALLLLVVLIMIYRLERLRSADDSRLVEPLPELAGEDRAAWNQLQAFGAILGDYGWQVNWNEPRSYEREGAVALLRGGIHSALPDEAGETTALGVDALTFDEQTALPPTDLFPLERWRDLHLSQPFTEDRPFAYTVQRSGRTYFIFYQYNENAVPSILPAQFETFLHEDSRQRAQFRRELAAAHAKRMESLEAIKTIQEALLSAGLYRGKVDGMNGWRTKHGLQRFLRDQGDYSGDIDGVFGNRTLKALNAFRARAGLDESKDMDAGLARAVEAAVASAAPSGNDPGSHSENESVQSP